MAKKINVYGLNIEEEALKQFNNCCSKNFVVEAALMPDAHPGYVAPIGSVIKTYKSIVPSWVGYDIGCGMIAVKIANHIDEQNIIHEKAQQLFNQVNRDIPMGTGRYNKQNDRVYLVDEMETAIRRLKELTTYQALWNEVYHKSKPNLGTLGSGNHFIEILISGNETWLVIHSGSRSVGHHIATYFMKAVSGLEKGFEETFAIEDASLHNEYMIFQQYCLEFALLNRISMAVKVEKSIHKVTGISYNTTENLWTNKNHNHCIKVGKDLFIHRKGATSSDKGERGVIPANMKDGCFLVEGLGNDDFLSSSSHGAGRIMSRKQAQKHVKLDQFKEAMQGIIAPIMTKTIDESPFAYKNITEVMELQKNSVKILQHLKPIINWKGF
ncbi:RNA-splicing ligase RtcB [Cardinium endosymbiont cEper1 of Encarsia pergandiella]|uniref:RtcB family protein n=1 Tax=Cardinium endosymbiont of Encarsia pergandiella TaxID=249402 RepID=UPI00027EA5AB|nr:RtcB family protein [Cardinium endosymbiont of Encarsia pergandiella]CCM10327.1 RNA-splicing ligase RtcB [Cardinium endosymbiont cEper1 of Encarsia pergandiella]